MPPLGHKFGELPDWLAAPLATILHDLQQPVEVPLRLQYSGETLWVQERGELDSLGMWVPPDELGAGLMVRLADELQEQFFPETVAAWGEARPACPGHSHPASPEILDDEAWWVCPADQRRIARIGELPR